MSDTNTSTPLVIGLRCGRCTRRPLFACRLVLNTITKMDGARKCYQLVGGVLIEKSIEGVIPDVTFNKGQVGFGV
jgi:hypothetical protein